MSDNDVFHRVSMVMNVDPAEIAKIVHDYINSGIVSDYDRLNYPKPPIYIGPVKVETLKERLDNYKKHKHIKEDNEMKATSVQNIKNIKDICFDVSNDPIERESKLTIVASTNDDIFAFEFEGEDLLQCCKRAGLFSGWEKDQKIRELEKDLGRWKKEAADCLKLRDEAQKEAYKLRKENEKYEEKIKKLEHDDMLDKNAADYWSEEHDALLERFAKLQVENEKLKQLKTPTIENFADEKIKEKNRKINDLYHQLHHIKRDKERLAGRYEYLQTMNEEYSERIKALQRKYNLKEAANEAQHKFIREYAGKGTEIEFNYAIDDAKEVSYVIVDKKTYDEKPNINLHGKDFTPDELVDRVLELEEENNRLKKHTTAKALEYIEINHKLQDENEELKYQLMDIQATKEVVEQKLNTREGILDQAKKCVCGQREQDYGTPESNFKLIADLWNGYLGSLDYPQWKQIQAKDVAMMMSLMKIARIRNGGGSGDSFVDLAGYAACGGEIWALQKETN